MSVKVTGNDLARRVRALLLGLTGLLVILGSTLEARADSAGEDRPEKVYVGVYAFHVPEVSIAGSTYLVDFWVWFRWYGQIDPTAEFEFLNQFEGDIARTPVYVDERGRSKPEILPDGGKYQVYRVQSRFGQPFDVSHYPFDEQALTIAFEDSSHTTRDLVYVPDDGTELVDPSLVVEGFFIDHVSASVREHTYPTNWGDPRSSRGADVYSQFSYVLHLRRESSPPLFKALVPITLAVALALLGFVTPARNWQVRIALSAAAFLALCLLQLGPLSLHKPGQTSVFDQIISVGLATTLLTVVAALLGRRALDRSGESAALRLDKLFAAFCAVSYFCLTGALVARWR
ncbi:MAG: hypothetical protein U0271_37710 [Polyangiaceae bacterium]